MELLFIAFIVGLILMLIPLWLTILEKKKGQNITYIQIVINILFITISLYYINFVPMYPHGPSPIWLALPAWPSFMFFYAIIYPKMLKDKKSIIINPFISGVYIIGSLVGLSVIIRDWNIV